MIAMPTQVDLTTAEREQLEEAAREARSRGDTRTWKRFMSILLLADGRRDVWDVVIELDVGVSSVYEWLRRWRAGGIDALADHGPGERPAHYQRSPRQQERLAQIVDLYRQGWKWSAIARKLGYRTAAGPWRLAHRAGVTLDPEPEEEAQDDNR